MRNAAQRAWHALRFMDDVNYGRYERGRIHFKDWLDCQHARLTHEIYLREAWASRTTQATRVPLPLSRSGLSEAEAARLREAGR